jgi:hypothetical protein
LMKTGMSEMQNFAFPTFFKWYRAVSRKGKRFHRKKIIGYPRHFHFNCPDLSLLRFHDL